MSRDSSNLVPVVKIKFSSVPGKSNHCLEEADPLSENDPPTGSILAGSITPQFSDASDSDEDPPGPKIARLSDGLENQSEKINTTASPRTSNRKIKLPQRFNDSILSKDAGVPSENPCGDSKTTERTKGVTIHKISKATHVIVLKLQDELANKEKTISLLNEKLQSMCKVQEKVISEHVEAETLRLSKVIQQKDETIKAHTGTINYLKRANGEYKEKQKEWKDLKKKFEKTEMKWRNKEQAAKSFVSKDSKTAIIEEFLKKKNFTESQINIMMNNPTRCGKWGEEDYVEALYLRNLNNLAYRHFLNNHSERFPMPEPRRLVAYLAQHPELPLSCTIKCCEMGNKLYSQSQFDRHMAAHQKVVCDICGKGFSSKQKRHEHIRHIHDQVKEGRCKLCQKEFIGIDNARIHIAVKHLKLVANETEFKKRRAIESKNIDKHKNEMCKMNEEIEPYLEKIKRPEKVKGPFLYKRSNTASKAAQPNKSDKHKFPSTSYSLFFQDNCQSEELAGMLAKEKTKYLGAKWKAMSEEEKRPWKEQGEILINEWKEKTQASKEFYQRPYWCFKRHHFNDPELTGSDSEKTRNLSAKWQAMSEEEKKPWKEQSKILHEEWKEKKLKEAAKDKQEAEEMLDIEKSMPINITASSSHNGHEHDMTEEDKQAVQSILSLSAETKEELI